MDFENTDSLISAKVKFWSWYLPIHKFGCPKIKFGSLHWQGDSHVYSMLISAFILNDPKVTENLEMRLGY